MKHIALIQMIKFLYWMYLELDATTCAEMPFEKIHRRQKADLFYKKHIIK